MGLNILKAYLKIKNTKNKNKKDVNLLIILHVLFPKNTRKKHNKSQGELVLLHFWIHEISIKDIVGYQKHSKMYKSYM